MNRQIKISNKYSNIVESTENVLKAQVKLHKKKYQKYLTLVSELENLDKEIGLTREKLNKEMRTK